jgi:SAM-dependent methyltransferase
MYRGGAPWESGPRPVLVDLCESGQITPDPSADTRAIDLGCGSGADSIYLAQRGFAVTGVDFSQVAIGKAQAAATEAGIDDNLEFVVADLLALPGEQVPGPFDVLFDGGTIDDFPPAVRPRVAETVTRLARPGAVFVMWCFYAERGDLPLMSFGGPSRFGAPPLEPGEEIVLFGHDWDIERVDLTEPPQHEACFVMTRR